MIRRMRLSLKILMNQFNDTNYRLGSRKQRIYVRLVLYYPKTLSYFSNFSDSKGKC